MHQLFKILNLFQSKTGWQFPITRLFNALGSILKIHKGNLWKRVVIWVCLLLFGLTATQVYAYKASTKIAKSTTVVYNEVGHQHEFRGVWAATVANIDWPSQRNLSVVQQKAELIGILDRMQELNLNALILQVRPAGDALYQSSLEPWSYWLTGTQGQPPQPYYDPLAFAIEESHKRNIELHAWFNPYRAQNATRYSFAENHMARKFPQYAYQYGNLIWMDPGDQEVQNQTYNVVMDVVRRYDVDGIHFDDYFYPYPKQGISFPDDQTYQAYLSTGGLLSKDDWRRNNVNQLIQSLSQAIHTEKPHVKFGISPFGIYRPEQPPGIKAGLDQYGQIYADPKLWMEQGWVDYLAPQLYWRIDPPEQSYPALLDWWVSQNPLSRHIYAGNYLSRLAVDDWPVSEFERQVALSRQEAERFSLGNIFFSMKMFLQNKKGVNDVFKASIYPTPALTPEMDWLDSQPPNAPFELQSSSGLLSWEKDISGEVRSWTLYQKKGENWHLREVLNGNTTEIQVSPGTYALSAVDSLSNESPAALIQVR
jgi:uncharacterized lipoprotein YddW (UPF0748 family)